ncbi:MAG: transposase [Gammaproteobacteria bacterium]
MSQAVVALKLRLIPDKAAQEILDGQSRLCNWLYNHLLEKANDLRNIYREQLSPGIANTLYTKRGLRNLVPGIKVEKPFLKVAHSSPLKNVALRLTDTIQTYQKSRKGKRKGKQTGWPQFRSWRRSWFSLLYDEPNKGFKIERDELKLSLGRGDDRKQRSLNIPIAEAGLLKGKEIRNLRIVKDMNVYYAVFSVTRVLPEPKSVEKIISLDPNHKNLAYGVDNDNQALEIESPWWLKQYDKRIDELKSKRDRCQKKSKK